jgi:lipoprotein-anchoring transpeptidase ErfK/SrfK
MKRSLAILAALAGSALLASGTVSAQQTAWADGRPVYESDARRKAELDENERAERRKSYGPVVYPKFMEGGDKPDIKPSEPPVIHLDQKEDVGSIIVDTQAKKLYYILPNKKAYQYPISVGRDGFTWSGTERISRIAAWPSWTPPGSMHARQPGLPITVTGGLKNPQGARALYLGNTIYRIHGTNNDRTVGRANSSGCFRLMNEHVVHLASIVKIGTKVKVLQAYGGGVSQGAPVAETVASLFSFGSTEPAASPAATAKPQPKKVVAKKVTAVKVLPVAASTAPPADAATE